jgi:hypothetical protein
LVKFWPVSGYRRRLRLEEDPRFVKVGRNKVRGWTLSRSRVEDAGDWWVSGGSGGSSAKKVEMDEASLTQVRDVQDEVEGQIS